MLDIFPQNTISVTYKRNKNLREVLSPSLFPRTTKQNECFIEKCNKRCDICKNFLVISPILDNKVFINKIIVLKVIFEVM